MEGSLPCPCRAHGALAIWTDDCPTTSRMSFDLDCKRKKGLLGSGETSVDANTTTWEFNREQMYYSDASHSGWSRRGLMMLWYALKRFRRRRQSVIGWFASNEDLSSSRPPSRGFQCRMSSLEEDQKHNGHEMYNVRNVRAW